MTPKEQAVYALEAREFGDLRWGWLVDAMSKRLGVPPQMIEMAIVALAMGPGV